MTQVLNSLMYASTEHMQMVEFTLDDMCEMGVHCVRDTVLG